MQIIVKVYKPISGESTVLIPSPHKSGYRVTLMSPFSAPYAATVTRPLLVRLTK
jgi:hypothetical protein